MAKYCEHCGAHLEDGTACGCQQPVPPADGEQSQPPQAYDTFYSPPNGQGVYTPPVYENRRADLVRAAGSTNMFLTAVILYTVNLVFTVIRIFSGSDSDVSATLRDMLTAFGVEDIPDLDGLYGYGTTQYGAGYYASSLIGMVIPVLIAIGLWQFCMSCRSPSQNSAAGLPMVKVSTIIYYSMIFFVLGLAMIAMIVISVVIGNNPGRLSGFFDGSVQTSYLAGIFMGVAIVLAIIVLFLILYLAAFIKTVNTAVNAFMPDRPSGKVSMFLVVINFISAFFTGLSALPGLFGGTYSMLSSLSALCSSVSLILITICILQFKHRYDKI